MRHIMLAALVALAGSVGANAQDFDAGKLYTLKTPRGYMPSHDMREEKMTYGTMTCISPAFNKRDAGLFNIIEKDGGYLLYNTELGKYLTACAKSVGMSAGAETAYVSEPDGTFSICPPGEEDMVQQNMTVKDGMMLISSNVTGLWLMMGSNYNVFLNNDTYKFVDNGSAWIIEPVEVLSQDGVNYRVLSEITGTALTFASPDAAGDVVIPGQVTIGGKNYKVACVGHDTFNGNTLITSVTLPEEVMDVDSAAFFGCTALKKVTIKGDRLPWAVKECFDKDMYSTVELDIQPSALMCCWTRKTWHRFENVPVARDAWTTSDETCEYRINPYTKEACVTKLVKMGLNGNVTFNSHVEDYPVTAIGAEMEMDGMKSNITLFREWPSELRFIGDASFKDCSRLTYSSTRAFFPEKKLESIGAEAFYGCKSQRYDITIGNQVTEIGPSAFEGNTSMGLTVLGNSVKTIGSRAFLGVIAPDLLILPSSIQSIGDNAFTELKSLVITSGIRTLDDYTFNFTQSSENKIYAMSSTPLPTAEYAMSYSRPGHANNYNSWEQLAQLLVPASSMEAYGSSTFWNQIPMQALVEPESITIPIEVEVLPEDEDEPWWDVTYVSSYTFSNVRPDDYFSFSAVVEPRDASLASHIIWRSTNPSYASVSVDAKHSNSASITIHPTDDEINWAEVIIETLFENGPVAKLLFTDQADDVKGIASDRSRRDARVFNLQGVCIKDGNNGTRNLPAGIYITGGKKIVVQ